MSRDFLLVLGGGLVSLATTLVILFVTDLVYRRDQARNGSMSQGQVKATSQTAQDQH